MKCAKRTFRLRAINAQARPHSHTHRVFNSLELSSFCPTNKNYCSFHSFASRYRYCHRLTNHEHKPLITANTEHVRFSSMRETDFIPPSPSTPSPILYVPLSLLLLSLFGISVENFWRVRFTIFNIACGLIFEETVKLQEEQTTDCVCSRCLCCCRCYCTSSHTICVRLLLANLSPQRNMRPMSMSWARPSAHLLAFGHKKRDGKRLESMKAMARSHSHKTMWWYWTPHTLTHKLALTDWVRVEQSRHHV